ncbi:MAG: hypothetical protein ABEI97_00480, partial [Candidatus Nanohaloarchaea archaeon]
ELDATPPLFDSITPSNASYITSSRDLKIDVSDARSGVSVGTFNNGTENQTFNDEQTFDPGWTSSATHQLTVWANDTVLNTNTTVYEYYVDDLPPVLDSATPGDTAHIQSSDNITVTVSDKGGNGGVGLDSIVAGNGTHNQSVDSGVDFDPGWTVEGSQTLTVWKNDTLGNQNNTVLDYTVDDTAPSTTDNHTYNGWRSTNKTVGVNTTDNFDADLISTCDYSTDSQACTPSVTGAPNVTVEVGCASGDTCRRILRYRANDTAGNTEPVQESTNVSIDKERPSITFHEPNDGDTAAGTADLKATTDDAGAGVSSSTYSVVNKTGGTLGDVIQTGSLNDTIDTNTIISTQGKAMFNITASDSVGNTVSSNITFDIDNQQVITTINDPRQEFVNDDFSLDVRAKRPGGFVRNMSYNITNSTQHILNETVKEGINVSSDNFTFTVTVDSSWTDGNLTLMAEAWDNQTAAPSHSVSETWFVLDRVDPVPSFTNATGIWTSGTAHWHYDLTDDQEFGTCQWQYRNSTQESWSGNFSASCGSGSVIDFDTTNCADDADTTCEIRLFGTDRAGNINSTNVSMKVDNSAPTAKISSPASGSWQNDDFAVSHTTSDDQGLSNRSYRVNGSGWRDLSTGDITVDISEDCSVEGSSVCGVTVNATNNVGDTVTAVRNVSIDTSAPVRDRIRPVNRSNLSDTDNITVDFDAAVAGTQKSVFNNGTGNTSFSDGEDFDPGWTAEQTHPLDIWVVDKAGNTLHEIFQYTFDATPPVFLSTDPANNSAITTSDTLNISINDTTTAVTSSQFDNGDTLNRSFNDSDAFDPQWSTDGYHWIDLYLADAADNTNHTAYRYFVDGTPPKIDLDNPGNGSVIGIDQNVTVNATDASGPPVNRSVAQFSIDNSAWETFPFNQSFDPGWSTEGRQQFAVSINDTLNNTGDRNYYFTIDDSPPSINAVTLNVTTVAAGTPVRIEADLTEQYSSINLSFADIIDSSGSEIASNQMVQFSGDTYNTTYVTTDIASQNLTVNVTVNDTFGHTTFNTQNDIRLDTTPPNSSSPRFNVSTHAASGETRIYRGEPIRFRVTVTDNVKMDTATVTLNTTQNQVTGVNHTLSPVNDDLRNDTWATTFTDTGTVGAYNLTDLYLNDSVANNNVTRSVETFHVVNHSVSALLDDTTTIDAGTTETLNVTVDFNRTPSDRSVRVLVPPSTRTGLAAPDYTNASTYTCDFGDATCTLAYDRRSGGIAR